MVWLICFAAVAAFALALLAATGRLGGMREEPVMDVYEPVLPARTLSARDLHGVQLGVTLRGYAMDQVDDLLDRLAGEIETRDRLIASLHQRVGAGRPSADDDTFARPSDAVAAEDGRETRGDPAQTARDEPVEDADHEPATTTIDLDTLFRVNRGPADPGDKE